MSDPEHDELLRRLAQLQGDSTPAAPQSHLSEEALQARFLNLRDPSPATPDDDELFQRASKLIGRQVSNRPPAARRHQHLGDEDVSEEDQVARLLEQATVSAKLERGGVPLPLPEFEVDEDDLEGDADELDLSAFVAAPGEPLQGESVQALLAQASQALKEAKVLHPSVGQGGQAALGDDDDEEDDERVASIVAQALDDARLERG